jgi:hypothetical protein
LPDIGYLDKDLGGSSLPDREAAVPHCENHGAVPPLQHLELNSRCQAELG